MKTHRCPSAVAHLAKLLAVALCAALFCVSCSNSNPVDGRGSPLAPTGVAEFDDPVEDVEFSDPSQVQVLQVWCVYEFDTDACVELEADYGHTVDDNYGIDPAISAATIDELTGLCAAGAGDRVACAELARR